MVLNSGVSVVIPVFNEAENIASLIAEIDMAASACPIEEIIFVDDGSIDDTAAIVSGIGNQRIRLIMHSRRSGQSAALRNGVRAARNHLIVTIDGDGQNDPADIPLLYRKWAEGSLIPMTLIAGQRRQRMDNALKKFTSRAGNSIRNFCLKDGVRDTGCSLKLFRREDYLSLPYFNHMHRFLPALFLRERGRILLVDVNHRPRRQGISKYGFWSRLWVGIPDIFGVLWLKRRACPPVEITEV